MLQSKKARKSAPGVGVDGPLGATDAVVDSQRPAPIELRVLIAPPSGEALKASIGSRRYENVRRYEWSSTELLHRRVELRRPHWLLDGASSPLLHDLTQRLPYSMLLLTHCTIATHSTGTDNGRMEADQAAAVLSSDSFTEQRAFDEAVSALRLSCPLRVEAQVAGFDCGEPLLGLMSISFTLQLQSSDHVAPESYMGLAAVRSISAREVANRATPAFWNADHSADRRRWSEEAAANTPAVTTRLAAIAEETVRLSTLFTLLPSVVLPMSARLMRVSMTVDNLPVRINRGLIQDDGVALFEPDTALLDPFGSSVDIQAVLNFHKQRVLASGRVDEKDGESEASALSSFMAVSPVARLSSLFLLCSPAVRTDKPLTIEMSLTSTAPLQLRGFHMPAPMLTFQLHSRATGVRTNTMLSGEALALLSISSTSSGGPRQLQCSTQVRMQGTGEMNVNGEPLDLLRMSDVMAAQTDKQQPSAPLSSLTTVRWLTETLVARTVPCLRPSHPPAGLRPPFHPFNDIYSSYHFPSHRLAAPVLHNLTMELQLSDDHATATAPACVLLDSCGPGRGADSTHVHLSFSTLLRAGRTLSFPQLLSLGGLQEATATVPAALLASVVFSSATSHLVARASDGSAGCMLGVAKCGISHLDELLWYIRLGVRETAPACAATPQPVVSSLRSGGATRQLPPGFSALRARLSSEELMQSTPVSRWLRLQCRERINEAVFPRLAEPCANRCLRPLWQHVYCVTDDGVTAEQSQVEEFDRGHMGVCRHMRYHPSIPTGYRPMNALVALQPHLPHGFLEVPVTQQLLTPPATALVLAVSASGPSASSSSSPTPPGPQANHPEARSPSKLDVECSPSSNWLVRLSVDAAVFQCCLDYLDCNSIFFGLLPAAHSLPTFVSAALTSASYWHRSLITRYGRYSDMSCWSADVLEQWRREGLQQRRVDIQARFNTDTAQQQRLLQLIDQEEKQLARYGVFHAAALDIQGRLNRFLVSVMHQPAELVIPQRAVPAAASAWQASQTAASKPALLHVPEAALLLLLSAPPFCPLPEGTKRLRLLWDGEKPHFSRDGVNGPTLDNVPTGQSAADFCGLLASREVWHKSAVWSLYTGPTYVYSDASSAGQVGAVAIDPSSLSVPADQWGRPFEGSVDPSRPILLLYPSDVNNLPVVRRTPGRGNNKLAVLSTSLTDCFKRLAVDRLISRTRRLWLKAAQARRADLERHSDSNDDLDEKHEKDDQQMEDAEEVDEEGEQNEENGSDDEGSEDEVEVAELDQASGLDMVRPLLKRLLNDMEVAMYACT